MYERLKDLYLTAVAAARQRIRILCGNNLCVAHSGSQQRLSRMDNTQHCRSLLKVLIVWQQEEVYCFCVPSSSVSHFTAAPCVCCSKSTTLKVNEWPT